MKIFFNDYTINLIINVDFTNAYVYKSKHKRLATCKQS
jgi:hypothetical protein